MLHFVFFGKCPLNGKKLPAKRAPPHPPDQDAGAAAPPLPRSLVCPRLKNKAAVPGGPPRERKEGRRPSPAPSPGAAQASVTLMRP